LAEEPHVAPDASSSAKSAHQRSTEAIDTSEREALSATRQLDGACAVEPTRRL